MIMIAILASCSINIRGVVSDYKKVNSINPNLIRKINSQDAICGAGYSDSCKVIVVNGNQLKNCIQNKDKAVIYLWNGNCKSDYCYGLDRVESYLAEKNITLYVVAEYYDHRLMSEFYDLTYPIVGIDTEYYKTDRVNKYIKYFFTDLSVEREKFHRLLYWENGTYIKSFLSLEDI